MPRIACGLLPTRNEPKAIPMSHYHQDLVLDRNEARLGVCYRYETDTGMVQGSILARMLKGLAVAIASFVGFGTVAALWENPLFIRMTPAGNFEVVLLTLLSILLGVYVAIRRPYCPAKTATASGIVGFIGIACPVCNKILLLLFGGELLLTYFEPVRIYVAGAGVLLATAATVHEWTLLRRQSPESVA